MLYFDKTTDSFIEMDIDTFSDDECSDTLAWDMLFDEAYDTCKMSFYNRASDTDAEDVSEDMIPMTPREVFLTQYGCEGFFESAACSDGYSSNTSDSDMFFRLTA